ncbi:Hypothetical protein SRAE_1000328200 [Strongyloides ratti]|uniref:Uncharacterized protein n=1 Tax=Strongyloides ratti TaxID=34506 RepID=A0A090MX92_STRRB|nr:Hypothetical protein SRAE_1000328200 [Strongyloides ratti]CEF65029.1 Hypothetical protein SRAE_1000328200 [Strongyloides ratti]
MNNNSITKNDLCKKNAEILLMDYEIQLKAPDPNKPEVIKGTTMYQDKIVNFKSSEKYKRIEEVYDYNPNCPLSILYNPNVKEVALESLLMRARLKEIATIKYIKRYSNSNLYKVNSVPSEPKICSIEILTPNSLIPMFITSYLVGSRQQNGEWKMLKKSNIYEIEVGYSFEINQAVSIKHFGVRGEAKLCDARDVFKICEKFEFPWKRVKYSLAFGFHQAIKTSIGEKLISTSNKGKQFYSHQKNNAVIKNISESHPKHNVQRLNKSLLGHLQFSEVIKIQKIAKNVSNPLKIINELE